MSVMCPHSFDVKSLQVFIVRARLVWVHTIARSKEHIPTSRNGIWIVSILHTVRTW